jgi:hypothetical protein
MLWYLGLNSTIQEIFLSEARIERRLAAVLAADVAGYSRLMGANEEGTLVRLKEIRKVLVDPLIAAHRGRIVKTTGDGLLVEFSSAVDAARCATEVQHGMAVQNSEVPQGLRIEFRIGIHVGDIIIDDNDIFGDGVNIAARLEGMRNPAASAFRTTLSVRSVERSISPSTTWVPKRSRTWPSRCAPGARGWVEMRPQQLRKEIPPSQPERWRFPKNPRSRCCRSRT